MKLIEADTVIAFLAFVVIGLPIAAVLITGCAWIASWFAYAAWWIWS